MNRELLRSQAAKRRNHEFEGYVDLTNATPWACTFCQHNFATENGFMRHHCKPREKLEELKGPVGQAAYAYYCVWMRLKKRSVPPIETFATSKLYSTFIKFARWVVKVKLPNTSGFIRAMVDADVLPTLWCRDNVYAMYLTGYDAVVSPTTQFVESLDTVLGLAKEHGVGGEDVFRKIGVDAVLDLVQQRKLSPWFLVASEAFRDWMTSHTQASRIEDSVKVIAMIERLRDPANAKLFKEFSDAARSVGL